ncbi:hypothetical protein IJ531_03080 [bacterium]|nr:hypothetical protein [bacterium]
MKKLLYILLASCAMGAINAADVDFTSVVNSTSMPSDAEIRAVVSKFNFDKDQQEILFRETKKKLQAMYASKNTVSTNAQLNQSLNQIKNGSANEYMSGSMKQEVLRDVSKIQTNSSTSSKTTAASTSNRSIDKDSFKSKSFKAQKEAK